MLVDDHVVIRAGLRSLLNAETDFEVVSEAADGSQVLQMAEQTCPDIILLDISMPNMGGIEALQRLRDRLPKSKFLMLTVHEDEELLRKAIRAGASGYVVKRAAEYDLTNAIRTVYQGEMYIHTVMTRALIKDLVPSPPSRLPNENMLTNRETEVLRLIVRGHTNNQIAKILNLSTRTVEGHRANIMYKLDLHSRVELVEYAEQHGLLD
jgi:two-component system response regulator NreC